MGVSAVEKIRRISKKTDIDGVKSGKIVKIDSNGFVYIDFHGNRRGPIQARITKAAAENLSDQNESLNLSVLVAFEESDAELPVIIDIITDRIEMPSSTMTLARNDVNNVQVDGESVVFDAKKEIVLRCGKSSITLTRAGKVLIRGAYLLNRSSGVNRIKGGSVQIN